MDCAFPERPPCGNCSLCQLRQAKAENIELKSRLVEEGANYLRVTRELRDDLVEARIQIAALEKKVKEAISEVTRLTAEATLATSAQETQWP